MEPRPEDRKDAEIADGAGELGFFPPYSWWPLWCAACSALIVFGIAIGAWWLLIIGVGARLDRPVRLDLRVLPRRARPLTSPLSPGLGIDRPDGQSRHSEDSVLGRRTLLPWARYLGMSLHGEPHMAVVPPPPDACRPVVVARRDPWRLHGDGSLRGAPAPAQPGALGARPTRPGADDHDQRQPGRHGVDPVDTQSVELAPTDGTFEKVRSPRRRTARRRALRGQTTWTSKDARAGHALPRAHGRPTTRASRPRTSSLPHPRLTLDQQTYPSIAPLEGETVGVGMPVIVQFDVPVTDKATIERTSR